MATIYGTTLSEDLYGSSFNDLIYGSDGNDTAYAKSGNDRIYGDNGNDYLYGEAGDDSVYGGAGTNYLAGGIGNDRYILTAGSVNTVVEAASAGTDLVVSYLTSYSLPSNVENLDVGTGGIYGYGNALGNTIYGNASGNYLWGGDGNDQVYAQAGNDTVVGGAGTNYLAGGTGDDSYILAAGSVNTVVEAAAAGTDRVTSYITTSYTLPDNVENLTLGTGAIGGKGNALNNVITGNSSANSIPAEKGNDTVTGGAGNDRIAGSANGLNEIDYITGGADADTFILGEAPFTDSFYDNDLKLGYGVITDFKWLEGDKFEVKSPLSDYGLKKDTNVIGGPALDTIIYYKGNTSEWIGVVQDTTSPSLSLDFNVV